MFLCVMLRQISPGIKYILISGIFFSFINASVKLLHNISAVEIVFFRSIISLIISYAMIRKLKIKIFNKANFLELLLRGLSGAIALVLYFTTIQNIPLAAAVTILYLAPIFTVILAIFINGEKPHPLQYVFMLLSVLGAVILKGGDVNISLKYFLMGITAAFFAGLAYNLIRRLRGRAHHHLIIFFFPFITIPVVTPMMISNWVTPNLTQLFLLISIGICTQIAQVYMTKAYLAEKVSKIGHYNYLTSIYAVIIGILFFNEQLHLTSIIGMSLIIIGVIFSARYGQST
jgi:drug/metabolite transporter (DMT)-like permease